MLSIKKRRIFLLFLLAFVLRLIVFLLNRPWDSQVLAESVLVHDAFDYHRFALCIIDHFSFCGETYRTPGYPFFIAVIYALFGIKPWLVLFIQIFGDLVTIYYVLRIGELLFSKRVGIIAAVFLAIDLNSIFTTARFLSDGLSVTFLMASMYYYLDGLKRGEARSFLSAGCLLALSALIRPVAQFYFIILFLLALLFQSRSLSVRLKCGFLYVIAFAIIISPWVYRNYALYDTAKLSSIQGHSLLIWQVATVRAWETNQTRKAIADEYMLRAKELGYTKGGNPFVDEKIEQKLAVQYIKTQPLVFASRWISGIFRIYFNLNSENIIVKRLRGLPVEPKSHEINKENGFSRISNFFRSNSLPKIVSGLVELSLLLTNYLMFLLGCYTLARQRQYLIFAIFAVSVLYFAAVGGAIGEVRYRLPITPFYLLVGAVYIDQLLNRRALRVDNSRVNPILPSQ